MQKTEVAKINMGELNSYTLPCTILVVQCMCSPTALCDWNLTVHSMHKLLQHKYIPREFSELHRTASINHECMRRICDLVPWKMY